jgi:hypothetical protein
MTMARIALGSTFLVAVLVGCAVPATETPAPEPERPATTTSALTAFNPCSVDWQLSMSYRWALGATDPNFNAFEDQLQEGDSVLVGALRLPKPYRAIVHVDVFREGTKTDPHSALWYLAVIPAQSTSARDAVSAYASVDPVDSRELGYCLPDGSFLPNNGDGPGNTKIKSVVTMYDPRCVCVIADGTIQIWTSGSYYDTTPSY